VVRIGDRISIQFKNEKEKSVVFFSHWRGVEFLREVEKYVEVLKKEVNGRVISPLDRLEPDTVMVDFIRYITENMSRVTSDLYLGKDEFDGDNSDNGHFIIYLSRRSKTVIRKRR